MMPKILPFPRLIGRLWSCRGASTSKSSDGMTYMDAATTGSYAYRTASFKVHRDQPRTDAELTPSAPESESPRGAGLPADSLSQARSSAIVKV